MQSLDSLMYDILKFIWPALLLFQVVISVIAFSKVKGTGALLMLVGTFIALGRSVINYLPIDLPYDPSGGGLFWLLMLAAATGRILFLVGLLLLVQADYTVEEPTLARTDF